MKLRTPAALAVTAVLSLGAAACGSDDSPSTATGSSDQSQAQARPEPVAQIDQLTGRSTAVALDGGFVEALTQLKLTPSCLLYTSPSPRDRS